MIGNFPIVTFDTSAHNRLVKDGVRSESVLAAIRSGLFFRFAGLSIDEMVACPDPAKRAALFNYCARLQLGLSDCIFPPNELIRDQVIAHFESPATFNWKAVQVRAMEYERGIQRRKIVLDPQLSAEQRLDQNALQKQYKRLFFGLRPKLESVFAAHGEAPPRAFREVIARLQSGEGTLIWDTGKLLYDRAAETDAGEETIKNFMAVCPPFRALIYGMLISWYDLAVRDRHVGERFRAGRNDLFMSVYLPYCDKFVTAEERGEQERCLREVCAVAGVETEILSYDDFCNSFLVRV